MTPKTEVPKKHRATSKVSLRELFLGLQEQMITTLSVQRAVLTHAGTKGDATEIHWLSMFNEYLPARYRADKAFVIDSNGTLSLQIDVVIYDRHYSPVVFSQNNAKYVPAESVYAIFEVKQEMNPATLKDAHEKAASVRTLYRTTAPIKHAGGTFKAKKPIPIIAGLLALDSIWSDPFGHQFRNAMRCGDVHERLDLGCVLKCGAFEARYASKRHVEISSATTALVFFFWRTLSQLQCRGTVAALDFGAYDRTL